MLDPNEVALIVKESEDLAKKLPSGGRFYGSNLFNRFMIALQIVTMERLMGGVAEPKTSNKVDKPCEECGKIMEGVFPTRKLCDECKGAK